MPDDDLRGHGLNPRIAHLRRADPRLGPLLDEILVQLVNSPYTDGRPACDLVPHLEAFAAETSDAYERGRSDRERELTEARVAALMATMDTPGGLQPYEPSQVSINVGAATVEELRAEVARLDHRLRWLMRHYDDAATSHLFSVVDFRDERKAMFERGVAAGLRQRTEVSPS